LGELQHRAKNSFSMICSLINLSSQAGVSEQSQDAFTELESRVRSVSELYSLLYASGSITEVRLDEYCRQVSEALAGLAGRIAMHLNLEPVTVPVKMAAPIGLIVNELLTNAIKYAFPGDRRGTITMTLQNIGSTALLAVADDGVGLQPDFDIASDSGMGLTLVKALTKQVGGSFRLEPMTLGTQFIIEFLLAGSSNLVP
jgi:two-component sensor histidine kinase